MITLRISLPIYRRADPMFHSAYFPVNRKHLYNNYVGSSSTSKSVFAELWQSSHHPQEVLLAQFSLYVHKSGLKPDSFHFHFRLSRRHGLFLFKCSDSLVFTNNVLQFDKHPKHTQNFCGYISP